jgi:hypothetical protein
MLLPGTAKGVGPVCTVLYTRWLAGSARKQSGLALPERHGPTP